MTRTLSFLAVILLFAVVFLVVRYAKDSYEVMPTAELQKNDRETNFASWLEFAAPNGQFKVLLPTLPKHAIHNKRDLQTNEMRQYNMYISETPDGTIFMISTITFPEHVDAESIADGLIRTAVNDLVAANPNNKLKEMQNTNFNGRTAIDFSIDNEDIFYRGRAFVADKTLYILTTIAKDNVWNKNEFDFFINSFDLALSK